MAEDWTKEKLKIFKPKYKAQIDNFNKYCPGRIKAMLNAVDPHNVNIGAKVTQRILAELTGIIPQNLNKLLMGRVGGGVNPSVEQAIRLAVVFGCSLDYIFTGAEPNVDESSVVKQLREEVEIERRLRKMTEDANTELKRQLEGNFPVKVVKKKK